jgi:FixJ family two-component response regulator
MTDNFPTVALVDDDVAARRALARLLAAQRYRVKQFSSAQQYLEADGNDAFCAVIDIDLGDGMSGLDLARQIKASASPIPIIFITGSIDGALRVQAWEIGCIDFLQKPCPAEELLAAVNAAFSAG